MKKKKTAEPNCAVCGSRPIVETDEFGTNSCDTCSTFVEKTDEKISIYGQKLSSGEAPKLIREILRKPK